MGQAGAEKDNRAKKLDHFGILVLQNLRTGKSAKVYRRSSVADPFHESGSREVIRIPRIRIRNTGGRFPSHSTRKKKNTVSSKS